MEGPLALLRRYGHDADPAVLAILHADLDPELKATLLRNHIARLDLPELSPAPVVGGVLPHPDSPLEGAAPASLNGRFKLSDPRLDDTYPKSFFVQLLGCVSGQGGVLVWVEGAEVLVGAVGGEAEGL